MNLAAKSGSRDVEVEFFRRQHGRCVLKVRGIDSIAEAEMMIGWEIRIPMNEILAPGEGQFYTFQLKGCRVFQNDEYLGTITDVLDMGGPEILKVEADDKEETLIPFAHAYLKKIDLEQRRIDVELPEGLRDINR